MTLYHPLFIRQCRWYNLDSMSQDDETFGVVEKPKRAIRKRAVTSVDIEPEVTPVPKKRAPRKKVAEDREESQDIAPALRKTRTPRVESVSERKAPTPIAATRAASKSTRRQLVVVSLLILIGVGASAGIGFTDKGSIDVNKTITDRNDKITRGEEQGELVGMQSTTQEPDGGLIGLGIGGPEATSTQNNPQGAASSTASSSEPVGQVPLTQAEAQAAAKAASQNSSSTGQSQ